MTLDKLIKSSKQVALISWIIGTLILLMFLLSSGMILVFIGLLYILVAGIINIIIMARLFFQPFNDKEQKNRILKSIAIIILNIPIMLLYCWIALTWMNTLRITFINETNSDLSNIKVIGCTDNHMEKLKKGQKKTLWIKIPNDCGVYIHYQLNGKEKEENVTGYVTNMNGKSMRFKIGTGQRSYEEEL